MDHSAHTPLSAQEIDESVIVDAPIYDAEDNKIGTISHTHGHGSSGISDVVIDVGGFLGIGTKPVLVSLRDIRLMRDEDGEVHGVTSWTKDQLKAMPEHRH